MFSEEDLTDTLRGELGVKSDWPVLLVWGFTVGLDMGLDMGLVEELLSSSV